MNDPMYPAGVTDADFNDDPDGVESAQEEWDRLHGSQYEAEMEAQNEGYRPRRQGN